MLLKKLAGPQAAVEITAIRRDDLFLSDQLRRKNMPLPAGHGVKALAAWIKAKIEGYDAVIFMADADSPDDRNWRRHHDQIRDGFSREKGGPAAVVCLPKSASESWLLADKQAWLAIGLSGPDILPDAPERIWGQRDGPDGNHPHRAFARVCAAANVDDCRETRVDIAERSTAVAVGASCPLSFGAFWQELTAAGLAPPPPSAVSSATKRVH